MMERRRRVTVALRLRPELCCVEGTLPRLRFFRSFSFCLCLFSCYFLLLFRKFFINFVLTNSIFALFRITLLLPPRKIGKRDGTAEILFPLSCMHFSFVLHPNFVDLTQYLLVSYYTHNLYW